MQKKTLAVAAASGCVIAMLAGCGVPQEEHDALVAQMTADRGKSEAALNGKIADLESLLKSEKAKVRTARIELDDATERIKTLQQQNVDTARELANAKTRVSELDQSLASTRSQVLAAQDRAQEIERKYNTLDVEYQELKRRFEMFENNLKGLGPAAGTAASPVRPVPAQPAPVAPRSATSSVLDILNEMGSK